MSARRWFTCTVVALVALAFAPIVARLNCARTHTPHSALHRCRADLRVLTDALEQYAALHDGRYPDELWRLTRRDADGSCCLATIPRDPWKARCADPPPAAPGAKPVLSSRGIDGVAGTADEVRLALDD